MSMLPKKPGNGIHRNKYLGNFVVLGWNYGRNSWNHVETKKIPFVTTCGECSRDCKPALNMDRHRRSILVYNANTWGFYRDGGGVEHGPTYVCHMSIVPCVMARVAARTVLNAP